MQADGESKDGSADEVDLLQFMSPNLGSGIGGMHLNWDSLYEHDRLWLKVGGGNVGGEGLIIASLQQFQFGNVTASSSIRFVEINGISSVGGGNYPKIVGNATAVGNLSDITICMRGDCDEGATEAGAEEDVEQNEGGGKPALIVTSTVDGSGGSTSEEIVEPASRSEDATEETTVAEETQEPVEEGLSFDLVMVPNLGSGIGPADWWVPGIGALGAKIDPIIPLLSRVLLERKQLIIGNVVATATVESIEADLPTNELAETEETMPDLPDIAVNAVAIGNSGSVSTDVGVLAIDRQIVIGSVDGSIALPSKFEEEGSKASMSDALMAMMSDGGIGKAEISAEVSAEDFVGSVSELSATSLANNHSISGSPAIETDGLVVVDLFQFSYTDTKAEVSMGPANITSKLDFSAVATAVGNLANLTLPSPFR